MLGWFINILTTGMGFVSNWLYGNNSIKAPMVGLVATLIWIAYVVSIEEHWLLVSSLAHGTVHIRNLYRMSRNKA